MKNRYVLRLTAIIFVTANFITQSSLAQIVRLSTGFDNYIGSQATVPAGWYISWNSTSSPSYYFSAGNYGAAIPSYKFGVTQDTIISPHFLSGDTLKFWCKGQTPFSLQNVLSVYVSSDSITWNQLQSIDSLPISATNISLPLPCTAHYVMFVYFKVNGNLSFDDVKVTMTNYSPVAAAATSLNFMCAGDSVCLFDVSTISGCDSIASRIWNFGDLSPLDTNANPCHVYSQTGNYVVWLRVTASNGNTDSTSLMITISPVPSAQFSFNNVNGTIVDFTDLSTVSSGSIVSRYWNFGDLNFSAQQNPTHFYSSIGMYYVCLTVTSNNSCVNTICDSVDVIGVGIEDYDLQFDISVSPNPAKNQLIITGKLRSNTEVEILDALGQRMRLIQLKASCDNLHTMIDISQLLSGIYFLKINSGRKPVIFKIIINH